MKRNRKWLVFLLLMIIIVLSACQNLEQAYNGNTDIKEVLLPFPESAKENLENLQIFWLYDQVVLLVRETVLGCSYDVFDWSEEKLIKSGELRLEQPPTVSQLEQASWVQLSQNSFLVKNLFDLTEAYVWEYKNGEVVIQQLPLEESFAISAVNNNATLLAGISADGESLQVFQIQQKNELQMSLEWSLTLEDLTVPTLSKLAQIAFINDEELVYSWNHELDSAKNGYGIYSIANQTVVSQNMFGSSKMVIGKNLVLVTEGEGTVNNPVEFAFIHANGESGVIKNDTVPFNLGGLRRALVSDEYVGFVTQRVEEVIPMEKQQTILTCTLLKPLVEKSEPDWSMDFIIISPNNLIQDNRNNLTLALTEDQEPLLVFYGPAYSQGYRQLTNPDANALYIVSRR